MRFREITHLPIPMTVLPAGVRVLAVCSLTLALMTRPVRAEEPSAADLLPNSVVAYAEIPQFGAVVSLMENHPLREPIEAMPVVQAARDSANLQKLRDGVAAFEASMGGPWQEAIDTLTNGGIYLAFDASSEGAALLIRSSDRNQLERFRSFVLAITQIGQGNIGIAKQADYRGFTAYSMGNQLKMALMDQWFLLTNQSELGKSVIDRYLDGGDDSLAQSERFDTAMAEDSPTTARGYLDLQALRDAGVAPDLYAGRTPNIVAEALFGGIASNLQHAPSAVASVDLKTNAARIQVSTPFRSQWVKGREYFFGENGNATAPPLIDATDRIFALSTHRDLSQMWLRAPDLMTDKANEELAQAETGLTTFFSGLDFGEEVLGSLQPGIQLVVCRQTFDDQSISPAIKLPAFALQFRMRNPELATSEFRRVFQNLVGFINVIGAMQGQPQLELGFEQGDDVSLVTSTYLPPRDQAYDDAAPIQFNFSPTIAFAGENMILSSTKTLARKLSNAQPPETVRDQQADTDQQPNTTARLDAETLAEVLNDNRSQLVAQNMLEKGHGPQQAQAEIDVIFEGIRFFKGLSVDLNVQDEKMVLEAELGIQSP